MDPRRCKMRRHPHNPAAIDHKLLYNIEVQSPAAQAVMHASDVFQACELMLSMAAELPGTDYMIIKHNHWGCIAFCWDDNGEIIALGDPRLDYCGRYSEEV
jgi:hypothetical protein